MQQLLFVCNSVVFFSQRIEDAGRNTFATAEAAFIRNRDIKAQRAALQMQMLTTQACTTSGADATVHNTFYIVHTAPLTGYPAHHSSYEPSCGQTPPG